MVEQSSRISPGAVVNRRRGVAAEELRRHNLSAVLERLHLAGPLSRSDLVSRTGLNRSTIGDLLRELALLGLVEESPGPTASRPGRPSTVARARPEGAIVLAIEMTVDSIAVATIGLGGSVYHQVRVERPRGRFSPGETVEDVFQLAGPLLTALPSGHVLVGIGVAVAGMVRRSDGFVHLAPNLGWRNVPLGEMVADAFGSERVFMANEADLGALGEYRRGSGAGNPHLIYVACEVGIGTGVIQNGVPMLGSAGYAGEAGHTLINPNGTRCRCGAVGCWETEAGEEALARAAGVGNDLTGQALIDHLTATAEAGDQRTLAALDEVGRWLGLGIGNLINTFNPGLIVIGGLYSELYRYVERAVLEASASSSLEAPRSMAEIRRCELGDDAPLMGAGELVLSEVTADPARFGSIPVP